MTKLRVGYLKHDQNWNRNICYHNYDSLQLVKVHALSRILASLTRRLKKRVLWLDHTVFGPVWPRVDLLHIWAGIYLNRNKWIVTSDVGLPFGWPRDRWPKGLAALASENCRKIIFISNFAMEWQKRKLPESGNLRDVILAKATILHPPQRPMIASYDEKKLQHAQAVRFALVGHHFFRKGGFALLKALDLVRREGAQVELVVVSKLGADGFLQVTDNVKSEIIRLLSNSNWVTWYRSLPNEKVLEILKGCHIGVLLSFAESYGYSVLEAQASGCAILSTDIGALRELNNEQCGWIIPISDVSFDLNDSPSLWRLQEYMVAQLVPLLREIVRQPSTIKEKGIHSLEKIRRNHDPASHRKRLEEIYLECVAR